MSARLYWLCFGVAALLWLVLGVLTILAAAVLTGEANLAALLPLAGNVGDTFGAVNALFSGLALMGVVVAIFLQRNQIQMQKDDLSLQREELQLTRKELAKSAEAQVEAHRALRTEARLSLQAAVLNSANSLARVYATMCEGHSHSEMAAGFREWKSHYETGLPHDDDDLPLARLTFYIMELERLHEQITDADSQAGQMTFSALAHRELFEAFAAAQQAHDSTPPS